MFAWVNWGYSALKESSNYLQLYDFFVSALADEGYKEIDIHQIYAMCC